MDLPITIKTPHETLHCVVKDVDTNKDYTQICLDIVDNVLSRQATLFYKEDLSSVSLPIELLKQSTITFPENPL